MNLVGRHLAGCHLWSPPRSPSAAYAGVMTFWDKLKSITKREAGAVREELGKAADALDSALAKKERELNATPSERVDMLLEDIAQEDEQFTELEAKLRREGQERAAAAGIDPPVPTPAPSRDLSQILSRIAVEPLQLSTDDQDRTSHIVVFDAGLARDLATPGIDSIVAALQFDVMVLDASRRLEAIAVRAPTLASDRVAALVARAVADHAPHLVDAPAPPIEPVAPDGPAGARPEPAPPDESTGDPGPAGA